MFKKKQKGYALLTAMSLSVVGLAFAVSVTNEASTEIQEQRQDSFIDDTSKQTIDFSTAVSKVMTGVGAVPGDEVVTSDLVELDLLNEGYTNSIAFNQALKAYYVTNPDNPDVIDVLIIIQGTPDASTMSKYGVSDNTLKSFYYDVIDNGLSKGYPAEEDSEEFYIGTLEGNGKTLVTRGGQEVDISHVNPKLSNNRKTTLGIYLQAPNQVGWWRMRVAPYLWQTRPVIGKSYNSAMVTYNSTINLRITNDGFSYYCPAGVKQIDFDEEFEYHKTNVNSSDAFYFCLKTYKGSVKEELGDTSSTQIFNPLDNSSPYPVSLHNDLWERCYPRRINYTSYVDDGTEDDLDVDCLTEDESRNLINPNLIIGLDNLAIYDSYENAQGDPEALAVYDMSRKGKDFSVPNVIATDGVTRKIDNRYLQAYHLAGTFITGGNHETKYSPSYNYFNRISGLGVKVTNREPDNNFHYSTHTYKDNNGNSRTMTLTVPLPEAKNQ